MMPLINGVMLAVSSSPAASIVAKTTVAMALGLIGAWLARRSRAAVRHALLAARVGAALVLTMSPLGIVAAPQSAGRDVGVRPVGQISVSTMLVIAGVTVSDRDGKSIEGLGANDFVVTEDGVPQTISIFEFQKAAATPQNPISSSYTVGYYPSNPKADGKFRKIEIVCKKNTMAKLSFRAGYYTRLSNAPDIGGTGRGGSVARSIGVGITPPVLIYKKVPEYSQEARKAKYQGTLRLDVEVDASGRVANVKVVRSLGLGLDENAIEAVRQWKFKPGMKDGKPVTVQTEVVVNFRLL